MNERQERFCQEYLVDLNASQAAIRAGYSQKAAGAIGFNLLKKKEIQQKLDQLRDERSEKTQISKNWVIERLRRIIEVDPRRAFHADGKPKKVTDLPDDVAAAVSGIEITKKFTRVKLNDRLKALELLGRHLGMFVDRVEMQADVRGAVLIYLPDNGRDSVVNPEGSLIDGTE